MLRRKLAPPRKTRGVTMIEVLVTFLIVTLGLLGAAGMQARLQVAESESFQRAQAIVLLQDMVDRINANRKNARGYVTDDPVGIDANLSNPQPIPMKRSGIAVACDPAPSTVAERDLCAWQNSLIGISETKSGANVGAMIGARGCVTFPAGTAMPAVVEVAVVWQGVTPTLVPAATSCASTLFTQANTQRAMIARIKIGCLQNDPTTGACITTLPAP